MRFLIVLLAPLALLMQDDAIRVERLETTPTQAVMVFTAESLEECSVEVAFDDAFTRLSHDSDEKLFPGAQRCGREGSTVDGNRVTFVAGLRRAAKASDGKFYSRALETNRTYYYRIRAGGKVKQGTFETRNLPLGKLYGEPYPFDAEAPGHYAWPTVDWKDASREYIDPLTGVALKRLSGPQMVGGETSKSAAGLASYDGGQGAWTNAENGAVPDHKTARYSGSSREPLFVRAPEFCPGGWGCERLGRWNPYRSLDDVEISLKAWCASEGCRSNENGERKVDVCLTVDGFRCATEWKTVEVGTSQSAKPAVYPSDFPNPVMASWGSNAQGETLVRPFAATYQGKVNVNGKEVTLAGGDNFPDMAWGRNSRIRIGDHEYLVEQVNGAGKLTLFDAAAENGVAAYSARNFGVLVRKSTESADLLEVDGVDFRFASSQEFEMGASGAWDFCAPKKVTSGDGKEGYLCRINTAENYPTMWFIAPDGESRFLGLVSAPYNADGSGVDGSQAGCLRGMAFNPNNPNEVFCVTGGADSTGGLVILRGTYVMEGKPGCKQPAGYRAVTEGEACHFRWELATRPSKKQSLLQKAKAFDPSFDPERFPNVGLFSVQGGLLGFAAWAAQDTMAWSFWVDTERFEVVSMQNYHSKAPCRFCAVHSFLQMGDDQYNAVVVKDFTGGTGNNAGPYDVAVTAVEGSADGSLDAKRMEMCPTDLPEAFVAAGASGEKCITVTLAGEACDPTPSQWESVHVPQCSWQPGWIGGQTLEEGDEAGDGTERFLLVKKLDGNRWVLLRNHNIPHGPILKENTSTIAAHAPGWKLRMLCAAGTNSGYVWVNFAKDRDGSAMRRDNALSRAQHGDISPLGSIINDYDVEANRLGRFLWYKPLPDRIGIPAEHKVLNSAGFAGQEVQRSRVFMEYLQTHPSWRQVAAPERERQWYLDGNPFAPGSGGNYRLWPQPSTLVEGSLYQLGTLAAPLARKHLATVAWSGNMLMQDVSGPGSRITGNAEDNWKYCVADFEGECVEGSKAGTVYMNIPGMTQDGFCGDSQRMKRPCFTSMVNPGIGIAQYGVKNMAPLRPDRFLTAHLQRYNMTWTYSNAVPVPDGSWAVTSGSWLEGMRNDLLLVKLPPFPDPDGVDRSNFVPTAVEVPAQEGASRARIRFGYAENGPTDQYFCTSRRQGCVTGGDPYSWSHEENRGEACARGCTISIPGISGRVAYYAVEWLDGQGKVVRTGAQGAVAIP